MSASEMPLSSRVILHVDLDYFYAQVEEREKPAIREKPVVVCVYSGRTADSGAVSTANYLARKLGISSGIPIIMAKRILKEKDAVFLPMRRDFYEQVSENVMTILRANSDIFEKASIDEAYLDCTKSTASNFENARVLARKVKKKIMEEEKLTCSIGVGPNKVIAKMAAGVQKPDGLTVVKPEDAKAFLDPMPVGKLYGVGTKTEEKMHSMGINIIGELATYDAERLVSVFGKKLGSYFHNAANGVDEEPVAEREEREQISRISTLKANSRDLIFISPEINRLAVEVHRKLMQEQLKFSVVSIIAILDDLSIRSKSRTLNTPTDSLTALQSTAVELLRDFLEEEKEHEVRRVGVRVAELSKPTRQKSLAEFFTS